jgi:ubiquinone/menaquinone biosynthesis C-methylase UbiE
MRRCVALGLDNASVLTGSAERIPLSDSIVDVVHARFAYVFGPGCERGIAEVLRVLRRRVLTLRPSSAMNSRPTLPRS